MNPIQRTHRFSRTILAALAVAATLAAGPGTAIAGRSHLGQSPDKHVVLIYSYLSAFSSCYEANKGFVEQSPDGTLGTVPYDVPEGYVLVVTDLSWRVTGTMSVGRDAALTVDLGTINHPVFSTGTVVDANRAAAGVWTGSAQMTSGFRVAPGTKMCPYADASYTAGGSAGGNSLNVYTLTAQGYLIKSK